MDSSRILISRGGMLMSIGIFPESLSQAIMVGRFLVGRLGVRGNPARDRLEPRSKTQIDTTFEAVL